jgi:hypothetical protein
MSGIKDQQNIDDLRRRLYDRSYNDEAMLKPKLTAVKVDVARGWKDARPLDIEPTSQPKPQTTPEVVRTLTPPAELVVAEPIKATSRKYRLIILLGSVGLFVIMAIISSVYLFFGANQISGQNINISLSAPFAIAAGEKVLLQVNVSNQNSVPIESATLILNYGAGTKSNDEAMRELFEERLTIGILEPGEARNIPINVIIFGEENEVKEIKATVEYRVKGSNGTFFKEAEPAKIQVNSSPLVVRVNSVEKVSSGQEVEFKITLQSNASTPQKNILVSAAYPNSFTFIESNPLPVYGQTEWLIPEIKPDSTAVITLKGRVNGVANEEAVLQFSAGTPRSDNQFIMGSVLSKTNSSYTIERPFIDVLVNINGDTDGSAVIEAGQIANVKVLFKNTLEETIYDMRVEISPKGNLIRDNLLSIPSGFYDSSSKTIRYEVSGMPSLAEVRAGETREFIFSVNPDSNQTTAAFDISTNVYARRVSDANASEVIVGTALAEAKYSSRLETRAQVGRSDSTFTDEGPIPPVAGEVTTYTLTFEAETGANDVTGMTFNTTLPQHVSWLNSYKGEGTVEFNPVSKQLTWTLGTMSAKNTKQLQVQVGLLPSVTHIGRNLVIVGTQELKATDRFTSTSLKAQNQPLYNDLSTEAGFEKDNGVVQKAE